MIFRVEGIVNGKGPDFVTLGVGGITFKISTHQRLIKKFKGGEQASIFTHLHVREDALELYGLENESELIFFELLISVSGVGPKSGLAILNIAEVKQLSAAIKEGRADLLTRVSGIGRKTAERIIIDLKNKVRIEGSDSAVKKMDADSDVIEALAGLGYTRDQAKDAVLKVGEKTAGVESRLKEALKNLSNKKL